MLSIGPYVVVREIPTRPGFSPDGGQIRTYRATDRLTGIPVLLHDLPTMTGVPSLPPSPALLPFTDIVVNAGEAYLVTELPPNAVPARDPHQAARGALAGLAALHESGLVHGNLNTAQLWSVDGPVRLAGGGRYPLGGSFTAERDLQALAATLDDLGGLPPILALLRTEPQRVSARDALQLLQAGEQPPASGPAQPAYQPEGRGVRFESVTSSQEPSVALPNLDPLSLLNHSAPLPQHGSYVSQTVWTTSGDLTRSNTDHGTQTPQPETKLPFKLDVTQWDVPDFMAPTQAAPSPAAGAATPTASLGWADVSRPLQERAAPEVTTTPDLSPPAPDKARQKNAASRAFERLRADSDRQRQLQEVRRDEVVAQLAGGSAFPGVDPAHHQLAALASGEDELPAPLENETPQERRRREHQARVEEEKLARELTEKQGLAAPVTKLSAPPSSPDTGAAAPAESRQTRSVRMRWDDEKNQWVRASDAARPGGARSAAPGVPPIILLISAVLALLLLFALVRALTQRQATQTATPAPCCDVQFNVKGGNGKATISILNTTSNGQWTAGKTIGSVPGKLHLPGEGTYKLNVASQGFTPATLDITVPDQTTATINLP